MKRIELVRHLQKHGCVLLREGEINDYLAAKICRDLTVPEPAR